MRFLTAIYLLLLLCAAMVPGSQTSNAQMIGDTLVPSNVSRPLRESSNLREVNDDTQDSGNSTANVRTAHYPTADIPNTRRNEASVGQCGGAMCDDSQCDIWYGGSLRSLGDSAHAGHDAYWHDDVRVGYDRGFLIASRREADLQASNFPFRLKLNGWGQIRHTELESDGPNRDLNQFQLKRGRLIFSGTAFNPNFRFFIQLDGRSSSGDDFRLLDYYLSFDVGHDQFGLEKGTIGFLAGKYKMPFTMARWQSGQEFEFTDRSMASTFFDVNRSLAWGIYGRLKPFGLPVHWETSVFNGLVTGGAETGSSGSLDDNFAYSARIFSFPIGHWGEGAFADFDCHERIAMRVGAGYATTKIDRLGSTEFNTLRVVDSGDTLANVLLNLAPGPVKNYNVSLYSLDASFKKRGWSGSFEYYFRTVSDFSGASVPDLFDHGHWLQFGYFLVPRRFQLLTRWSRVSGNSGTLGVGNQSSDEVAAGFAWYFNANHAKLVSDVTRLDGAPINSASLDIDPGDRGWLFRTQIQFSF